MLQDEITPAPPASYSSNSSRTPSSTTLPVDLELGVLDGPAGGGTGRPRDDSVSTQKDEAEVHVEGVGYRADSSRRPSPTREEDHLSSFERGLHHRTTTAYHSLLHRSPRLSRAIFYLSGPSPPITETSLKPFLPRIESLFNRLFRPLVARRTFLVPLFLIAWFLGFTFLVRASYFNSSTSAGEPSFIVGDATYWSANDGCDLNGARCEPFTDSSFLFRCPGQTLALELLNNRAVGPLELVFQPLVVGGMDELGTYRADSWICIAAIHRGLFGNERGGCGQLEMVGEFTGYEGGRKNGVDSVGFDSVFPSSFRFVEGVSQGNCQDLRNDILAFNVVMTVLFSFVLRPLASTFYWVLFCLGFWHVVLVSDPTASPPNVSLGFQYFLPALFVGYAFWHFSFSYVVPAFDGAILEKTVWYLGGFWVGVLINVSLAWIPITRLTPSDIAARPGGLVAVIVLAVFIFLVIVNQLRVIRRTGWFFFYLKWYAVGIISVALLFCIPDLEFRMHHYIAALILMPGCAFVTRPSALFQGFLLGMFLDGIGRWGFDSILQSAEALRGDGALGSDLPSFVTSATNFTLGQAAVWWDAVPEKLAESWDGFGLIVDDVLRYEGTATNFSIAGLDARIPHYFRLAYQLAETSGDFTKAATAFLSNGTWIDAAPGPG